MTKRHLSMGVSRRRWLQAAAALPMTGTMGWARAEPSEVMAKIQARGRLTVAVYNAMPPFHVEGTGIDAEIAQQLASEMGLQLSLMPFNAGENMGDDLRNMVWKGHYLGFGPADVLLHVPVDKPLMDSQPQSMIFAPYFRESVALAYHVGRAKRVERLADLRDQKVAVAGQTLAGWLLIGADGGAYRAQLLTHLDNGVEAARMLINAEVNVAAGNASELHSVIKGDPQYRIIPLPVSRAPRGAWAVGMAVKKSATDLAEVLQTAMHNLAMDGRLADIFSASGVPWNRS